MQRIAADIHQIVLWLSDMCQRLNAAAGLQMTVMGLCNLSKSLALNEGNGQEQ